MIKQGNMKDIMEYTYRTLMLPDSGGSTVTGQVHLC